MPRKEEHSTDTENRLSKKPPKGILKNSNPNASYHKSPVAVNKRIEDLIEYERPRSSPPSQQRHGCADDEHECDDESKCDEVSCPSSPSSTSESSSRRHSSKSRDDKHRSHSHHKSKSKSHRRSSGGSSEMHESDGERSKRRSSSTGSHRHHRHHHKSSRESEAENTDRSDDKKQKRPRSSQSHSRRHNPGQSQIYEEDQSQIYNQEDDESNIYDMPKMPPVPVSVPPPHKYANEESKNVEQLYNKVVKSSKQASKNLQVDEKKYSRDENLIEGVEIYQNLGYDNSDNSPKLNENLKNSNLIFENDDIFEEKFITVGEALSDSPAEKTLVETNKRSVVETSPEEALYDVPRSNRRVSSLSSFNEKEEDIQQPEIHSEAIYVNENFDPVKEEEFEYQVPRPGDNLSLLKNTLPENYDVARIRDSLSTIEEEHQEYDVPKAVVEASTKLGASISDENLYENTLNHKNRLHNETNLFIHEETLKSSEYSSHGGDDRSSGYRSASSPSIQSTEELYVNESAIGSFDDSHISSPELFSKKSFSNNVDSIKRNNKTEEVRERKEEEIFEIEEQREKLEFEQSDIKSNHRAVAKSVQPPRTFFTDSITNKIFKEDKTDLEIDTKELRKKFEASSSTTKTKFEQKSKKFEAPPAPLQKSGQANKKSEQDKSEHSNKKFEESVKRKPEQNFGKVETLTKDDKRSVQKDRSVDVYNETVRQRVTKSGSIDLTLSKAVFVESSSRDRKAEVNDKHEKYSEAEEIQVPKSYVKKRRAPQPQHTADINDDELPSVRQLRDKFESDSRHLSDPKLNVTSVLSSKKREALNKLAFKKGFNVMSSLTRRGAAAFSISMHNLSIDNDTSNQEKTKAKKSESKKRPSIMDFDKAASSDREEIESSKSRQSEESSQSKGFRRTSSCEDDIITSEGFTWNPSEVVSRLYTLQEIEEESETENGDDSTLEGYLERLPPGKKKTTIWNSWKRQYFVAKNGLLLIFGDKTRQVLMDRIELFGGRVDFMESTMLGVQDRRGHYVVIKCEDAKSAGEWERVISKHVRRDLTQMFVNPVSLPKSPKLFTNILVVDFGGASVRAGIVPTTGPTLPSIFFPTVMAVGKSSEAEKYFGFDAIAPEIRSRCSLHLPMAPSGRIDKLSVDLVALQGIFEKIFKDLDVDPSSYEIQLSAPRPFGDSVKASVASMLFDEFSVAAVNMSHQTVFAMQAYNAKSGVIVDLGERMDVVPVIDGYRVSAGVSRSSVGGLEMRQKLQHHLQGRNYSLTSFVDGYLLRYTLENSAYMSRNFDRELDKYRQNPTKIDQNIDVDSKASMQIGSERFEACEGLFKPELWGLDQAGVHVLVHKAIRECGVDVRKEITQSIFLAGGLTMIPGFKERLEHEVEKLTPAKPRVHASPYRYHAAFIGASAHANSTAYDETKVRRKDWTPSEAKKWNL